MATKKQFEELLQKLYRNKANHTEIREIFRSLRNDKNLDSSILPNINPMPKEEGELSGNLRNVWSKVENQISPDQVKRRIWKMPAIRVAAAIALLVIASLAAGKIYLTYSRIDYVTQIGEIRTIELEDGSTVVLNGNSRLRVKKNLSVDEPRDVYLTGEANFQIARATTADARFVVHTKDLNVEVLGTRFNVDSRDLETVVYLEEGSVKVSREELTDEVVYMSPGERLEYSIDDHKLTLSEVKSEVNEISWREGIFEFENLTLDKIMNQITEPYDLKYEIESQALKDRTFTVRIPDNDLEFAISVLEKLTGASFMTTNGTIVVRVEDKALRD